MQQEAQHTEQEASGGNLALQPVTLVLVVQIDRPR